MKLKLALLGLLALCVLVAAPVSQAYGFAYTTLSMPASYCRDVEENMFLQHSTGVLIYTYFDVTNYRLHVVQYSAAGVLQADTSINVFSGIGTSVGNNYAVKVKIVNVNATYVLVAVAGQTDDTAYVRGRFACVLWNVGTKTGTVYQYSTYYSESNTIYKSSAYTSSIAYAQYNSLYWFFFQFGMAANANHEYSFECFSFSATTHAFTNSEKTWGTPNPAPADIGPVFAYQNPTLLDQIYLIMARDETSLTTPIFYRLDLDTGASGLEVMATGSSSFYTSDYHMFFLGSGVETSGGDAYLWFNMVRPYNSASVKKYVVSQSILKFNGSTISLATILSQDSIGTDMTPVLAAGSDVTYMVGYAVDYLTFKVFFPQTIAGVTVPYTSTFTMSDFFSGSATMSYSTWTVDSNNPVNGDVDLVAYNAAYSSQARRNGNTVYIYYSLTPESATWDITLVWVPADATLITNKPYTFTMYSTLNGYAATVNVFAYVDGGLVATHMTDGNGHYVFGRTFYTVGLHNMTFALYDLQSGYQYKKTFLLTVTTAGAAVVPPPSSYVGTWANGILSLFPLMLVIGVPAAIFTATMAKFGAGMIGLIFGVTIGVAAGFMGGIIPPSIFYFFILVLAAILVFSLKSKAGGGGGIG